MQVLDKSEWLIDQGRALVRAIEALEDIDTRGWFARSMGRLLHAAYEHRLDEIVELLPDEIVGEIAQAGEEGRYC